MALVVRSSAEIETLIEPYRNLIATKAPRSYRNPIWRAEDFIAINVDKVPEFLKEFKLKVQDWDVNGDIATVEHSFNFGGLTEHIPCRTTIQIVRASATQE